MSEFLWISLHKKWSFPLSRKKRVEKGGIRNKWVKAAARGCSKDSIMKDYFGRNMSIYIEPYSGWAFSGLLTDGGGPKRSPLPKICHIYPTKMKLGTVIPYPMKIQKIYESRDTRLEFCWYQHFSTGNQQIVLYQEIQI